MLPESEVGVGSKILLISSIIRKIYANAASGTSVEKQTNWLVVWLFSLHYVCFYSHSQYEAEIKGFARSLEF